jgi:IS605 OrfB family transposase
MKLTAQILLRPTEEQATLLLQTMEVANAACNEISAYALAEKVFSKFKLQKALYHDIKNRYNTPATGVLSAQVVVRCMAKVADAYKSTGTGGVDKETVRTFKPRGGIAYDARILRYYTSDPGVPDTAAHSGHVSIWTMQGRQRVAFVTRPHHARLLKYQHGESDLVYRKGNFYLLATCDVPEPAGPRREDEQAVDGVLGVDLGIKELASDNDGDSFSGQIVEEKRQWFAKRRATLQSVGTKSAKRRLRQLAGKEKRFRRDVNHVISKQLVGKAKDTNRAIALEDLTGIRKRITVRKSQKARHHGWSFFQLRSFIEYKAKRAGVPVVLVDPRNTSRTCSKCGHCDKKNRKSQAAFVCRGCGHSMNADYNAAINIAARVDFSQPMVSKLVA